MTHEEYLNKYKRCLREYTNAAGAFDVFEDENDNIAMAAPADGPGSQMNSGSKGGFGTAMPEYGNGSGMDGESGPAAPDSSAGDTQPGVNDAPQGIDGFNPQNGDAEGMEGMGGDEKHAGLAPDDEVIDVDDLTKSQEKAEEKIDRMNGKFERLMKAMNVLIKQNAERDAKEKDMIEKLSAEIDRRIPTPQQKMTMRSLKSAPFNMTPDEYMNNCAPDNYSGDDDRNGEDDPQYKITKGDIDRFTDYASIAKDLDIEHQGLNDILNFRG